MTGAEFVARLAAGVDAEMARRLIRSVDHPIVQRARESARTMYTSDVIACAVNTAGWKAAIGFDLDAPTDMDENTAAMVFAGVASAFADELDRRIPIPILEGT